MNLDLEPGNNKQNYVVLFPSPVAMVKSHEKECRNYFFKIITTTTVWWNVAKNVDFEEMDTDSSIGKNYGFWVLWGISKEYIKQNFILTVSRKSNSHSVVTCRLTNKSAM